MSMEGYFWPATARKVHYMVDGRSLCGRWMLLFGRSGLSESISNRDRLCVVCGRKMVKRELAGRAYGSA